MNHRSIAIVSQDGTLTEVIGQVLGRTYSVEVFQSMRTALDLIYHHTPDLLVFDTGFEEPREMEILNNLKADPIFNRLPVLAVLDDGIAVPSWNLLTVEDYLWRSSVALEIEARTELSLLRCDRIVEINPLTRLPGNISINRSIQKSIDKKGPFALAYADLDNFKPFNDHYGFSRGDDIIKMTGRLILNIVQMKEPQKNFVGHIGGDDFVFMMSPHLMEETAKEIIIAFDGLIPTFYDTEDWARGYIDSIDRHGVRRRFPPVSLSVGITSNGHRKFTHYGQVTEAVSEMKSYAKRFKGSCYRWDKRHNLSTEST